MPPRSPDDDGTDPDGGYPDGPTDEAPVAPAIPSFASLRARPGHSSALDLLVPPAGAATPPAAGPEPQPEQPAPSARPAPRPAEYGDLLRLGEHVLRRVAALPVRVALWSVREPLRCLGRLLGDRSQR